MNTDISIREPGTVPIRGIGLRAVPVHALAAAALIACFGWSYAPTLVELWAFWQRNEDYSVGQLVPPVALYLLWRKRARLAAVSLEPCWWGAAVLVVAQSLRLGSALWELASLERYSIPLSIAGAVLLVGGRALFRQTRSIIGFMFLMVPLPTGIHEAIAVPLQSWATSIAVFMLELLGFFVVREGNVLWLQGRTSIAVTEACSGLRMLTAFVFVAAVIALVLRRPRWQKISILAAGVPIAVISNAIRIVATAIFACYARSPESIEPFHDVAGLMMMPFGLVLSLGLLAVLDRITTTDEPATRPGHSTVRRTASGRRASGRPVRSR